MEIICILVVSLHLQHFVCTTARSSCVDVYLPLYRSKWSDHLYSGAPVCAPFFCVCLYRASSHFCACEFLLQFTAYRICSAQLNSQCQADMQLCISSHHDIMCYRRNMFAGVPDLGGNKSGDYLQVRYFLCVYGSVAVCMCSVLMSVRLRLLPLRVLGCVTVCLSIYVNVVVS